MPWEANVSFLMSQTLGAVENTRHLSQFNGEEGISKEKCLLHYDLRVSRSYPEKTWGRDTRSRLKADDLAKVMQVQGQNKKGHTRALY